MRSAPLVAPLLVFATLVSPLAGQDTARAAPRPDSAVAQPTDTQPRKGGRWEGPEGGLHLSLGLGEGAFKEFVEVAGGFGGHIAMPIAGRGALSVRAALSVLYHASDWWLGSPPMETDSHITTFRAGPQIALSVGRFQLYGFATGGFSYFATDADPQDNCDCQFTQTLHDDFTLATELGAGLRIQPGGPFDDAALDLGIRSLRNGEATYVTASGITQNSDGSFTVRPTRSDVSLLVVHLGVGVWVR